MFIIFSKRTFFSMKIITIHNLHDSSFISKREEKKSAIERRDNLEENTARLCCGAEEFKLVHFKTRSRSQSSFKGRKEPNLLFLDLLRNVISNSIQQAEAVRRLKSYM